MGQLYSNSKPALPWSDEKAGLSILTTKWKLFQYNLKIMSQKDLNRLRILGIFQSSKLVNLCVTTINLNFKMLSKIRSIKNIRHFALKIKPAYSRVIMKYDFQHALKNMKNLRRVELLLFNVQFYYNEFFMNEKYMDIIKKLRKLDTFELTTYANDLTKQEKQKVQTFIKPQIPSGFPKLTIRNLKIKITQMNNLDRCIDNLTFFVTQNKKCLTSMNLDLSSNSHIDCTYENFEAFAQALAKNKYLKSFDIDLFKSKKAGSHLLVLADALHKCKDLRNLRIKLPLWDQLSAQMYGHLMKVIEKIYKIETLDLEFDLPIEANEYFNYPFVKNPESFDKLNSLALKVNSQETPTTLITYTLKQINNKFSLLDLKYNQRYFLKHLSEVLMKIRAAKEMKLSYTIAHPFKLDPKETFQIFDFFERASNLSKLNLELLQCSSIHDECWKKTFSSLPNVKDFALNMVGPTDFNFVNLQAISQLIHLESLVLEINSIELDKYGCDQIISVIKDMNLVTLGISFSGSSHINDNVFYSLKKYINEKTKSTLENFSVKIDNCSAVSYYGITTITPLLAEMRQLKTLTMIIKEFKGREMKVEDETINSLAQSLAQMPRLTELNLELRPFQKITDASLLYLFNMLQASLYLRKLVLNFYGSKATKVSSKAAQILVKSLSRLNVYEISLVYIAELASFI